MTLRSTIESDSILHLPELSRETCVRSFGNHDAGVTLIFLITGNPGLISYYNEFLSLLAKPYNVTTKKDSEDSKSLYECVVAGFSLGGFGEPQQDANPQSSQSSDTTIPADLENELAFPPGCKRDGIYSLRDQIELCYARLDNLVGQLEKHYRLTTIGGTTSTTSSSPSKPDLSQKRPVSVILAGHSVGAYIALEMVRLHHQRCYGQEETPGQAERQPRPSLPSFTITSALLLTPTIFNISHSPSGRIATPLLSYLPFFPSLLQLASSTLSSIISQQKLEWVVSKVTGMKRGSAGLAATVRFLRCPGAVEQALRMARDEMAEIGEDRWGEEVWGVACAKTSERGYGRESDSQRGMEAEEKGSGQSMYVQTESNDASHEEQPASWKAPRLYSLFAKTDHWVADVTRDEWLKVIEERHRETQDRKPVVVVDEDRELVHAWCLEQSELVARRCRMWIGEILKHA